MNDNFVKAQQLPRTTLPRAVSAKLPDGTVISTNYSCLVPVAFGPTYKADIRALCFPLHDSIDMILGMPWAHQVDAILYTRNRQISLRHHGKLLHLNDISTPAAPRHGASTGSAGAERRSRSTLPPAPVAVPDTSSSGPRKTPHPDASPDSESTSNEADPDSSTDPPPTSQTRQLPAIPPAPDIHQVRRAALSNIEVLSSKQWRRLRKKGAIATDEVLLFHLTTAHDVVASTLDQQPIAIFNISDHIASETERLAALDAALPNRLRDLLSEYEGQFKQFPDCLPDFDPDLLQKIHFTGDKPTTSRPYRLSPPQLASCREQLKKLLAANLIRPAASPFAAPVLMVPKPHEPGAWRLTVDYRALNSKIERDSFPIPHPEDVFNELAGHKYYSRLDLASGFWQIRIDPADEDKTAFVAPTVGQFAFRVLPMGIKTAPSVFCRLMQKVLAPFLGEFAVTYMDDIGIYSNTIEEHLKHIGLVMDALRQHHLFAKLSKCSFFCTELEFLGHIVSSSGIAVDPAKVSAINEWPEPTDVSTLRSFLGLANYYRAFVLNFSARTAPLTDLLSANKHFEWSTPQQFAFADLKQALTSAPLLQPYRADRSVTLVMSDASALGLGAVLMQADNEGRLHPVAYHSRKLSPAERNYPTREQELLAIIDSLRAWRHYLLGIPFKIQTDHASLRYLQTQPHLSGRLVRWAQSLQEYDFSIEHVPGKDNVVADALSRRCEGITRTLRPDLAADLCLPLLANLSAARSETRAIVVAAQEKDPDCINIRAMMLAAASIPAAPVHRAYLLSPDKKEILWVGTPDVPRLFVPATPPSLRRDILSDAHDSAYNAHLGIDKTYARLASSWFWPNLWKDCRIFVTSCHSCLGNKPSNQAPPGLARPLPPPTRPWTQMGLDLSGPHPTTSQGNTWLIVFTDHFSKQVHLAAAPGNDVSPLTAERIAEIFFSTVVKQHGLPDVIVSDRGSQWLSSFWTKVFTLCGTRLRFSTAYHPQTDGAAERAIRTVVDAIRCCLDGLHEKWDTRLDAIELAFNSSQHSSTGITPFEAVFGFNPRLPLDLGHPRNDTAKDFLAQRNSMRLRAADVLVLAVLRQAIQIDKHRRPMNIKIGDLVWLSTKNLNLAYPNKFTPKYLGPFAVSHVMSSGNACKLDLPPSIRVKESTFNVSQLREHVLRPNALGTSAPPQPPPAFVDDTGVASFHIEKIVGHELRTSGVQ